MTVSDEERDLRLEQMRADIGNKMADTDYKRGLLRYEPWKLVSTFVIATAAIVGVLAGFIGYRFGQTPPLPQTVIIQQQPAPK